MTSLAAYDYRGLGRLLRERLEDDGRGWRACAAEIGVSASDLSRICNGQPVSAPKVIAVCDWLRLAVRAFYEPPDRPAANAGDCPPSTVRRPAPRVLPPASPRTGSAPTAREAKELFHGKSTETGDRRHAG